MLTQKSLPSLRESKRHEHPWDLVHLLVYSTDDDFLLALEKVRTTAEREIAQAWKEARCTSSR